MTRTRRVAVATLCSSLVVLAPLGAQTHLASMRGWVIDATRAPLAGATTRLTHEGTREVRTATSDESGRFVISQLSPGPYRLEVELAGYKRHVQRVALRVDQELWIDVPLEVGAITEEVLVTAPYFAVERESAAVRTVIEGRQIGGLPLDGRNFLELALLTPGAAPSAPGSAGSVRGDFAFTVNGAREDANGFLLDGVYNLDPKLNTPGVRPPVDAIQEFEVLGSTYDASFGRNAGGQINVITRSGTNDVDGTLYGFFRHGAFDARPVLAPAGQPAPDYERYQLGGSFGGPLAKDRTFVFADYEATRLREAVTRLTNVPTLAERIGDFSQSPFAPPRDPFTGQPFPVGRIPAERLSPTGLALAALYPEPNRATALANYVSSPYLRDRNDHFDARIDHRLGTGSTLTARYSFGDRRLHEPFSGPGFAAVPGYGSDVPRCSQNLAVTSTSMLGPSLVSETRVAWGRVASGVFHENMGHSLNRAVGLPELSANVRDHGLSFITVSGYSPLGDEYNNPQDSTTSLVQALETLTWARGAHVARIGAELRATRQDAYRDVQARGFLTFSERGYTGNALADLLLGLPVLTGGARLDNPQRLRTETYSLFAQDSIKVRPDLTIAAGVRYEYTSPPVDPADRATVYDPASRALVPVGAGGIPRSGYEADANNWAPRIGFAWAPGSGASTVVRGGYGVYYDQSALAPGEGLYFNAPYFDFNLYFPLPGLPLTLDDPFPRNFSLPLPESALTFQRDLRSGYLHHWSVSLGRQLGASRAVDLAYVGSRGRNLVAARDINQPAPSPQPFNLRPVPQFADITAIESRARSRYDALQVRVQQRLDAGLSLLTSYTLSKSMDDASGFFSSAGDPNFPQDSNNPRAEWGRSNFDVRHRLSVAFTCALPYSATGPLAPLLAGWEVHGIVTLQSGRPFTVALLPEIDNSNTGRSVLGFGANDRPNQVGDPAIADPTADAWFRTAAFAFPPFGSFGNAGRNALDGPGYANVNVGLLKHVPLGGEARLQLRVEAFNLFNRSNLGLPDNFLGSPTFGRILTADSPRRIQFGVKVLF